MKNKVDLLTIDLNETSQRLIEFIKGYITKLNKDGAIVGVSGD